MPKCICLECGSIGAKCFFGVNKVRFYLYLGIVCGILLLQLLFLRNRSKM